MCAPPAIIPRAISRCARKTTDAKQMNDRPGAGAEKRRIAPGIVHSGRPHLSHAQRRFARELAGLAREGGIGGFRQADAVKALRLRRPKARERNQRLLRKVRDRSICHAQWRFAREPAGLAREGGLGELSTGCDAVEALRLRRPKAEGWESAFPEGRFETESYAMQNGALPANRRGLRGQAALGSFRQAVTRWRRCVFFLLRRLLPWG